MKVKELISLNNEKREHLSEENLSYYENMLLYIRLSSTKSEQHTEEILLELLEHMLEAQKEGKTVIEVFGNDPKSYCQTLIQEIPRETNKNQIKFALYIGFLFLAITSFTNGIVGFGLFFFFNIGTASTTFYLGSGIFIIIVDLFILFLFIFGLLKWLRASAFKKEKQQKSWIEFLQIWFVCTLFISLFVAVIFFMPEFGTTIKIPTITFAIIGIVLYLFSLLFKK